jgi:hypothetical protein
LNGDDPKAYLAHERVWVRPVAEHAAGRGRRAAYVDYASELIEQIVMEVGDALAVLYGGDGTERRCGRSWKLSHAVRDDQPIDSAVRAIRVLNCATAGPTAD